MPSILVSVRVKCYETISFSLLNFRSLIVCIIYDAFTKDALRYFGDLFYNYDTKDIIKIIRNNIDSVPFATYKPFSFMATYCNDINTVYNNHVDIFDHNPFTFFAVHLQTPIV